MYIRRKVFSLLRNEKGEERYFSTTEFEKCFTDMVKDMELEKLKNDIMDDETAYINAPKKAMSKRELNKAAEKTSNMLEAKRVRDELDQVNAENGYRNTDKAKELRNKIEKLENGEGKKNLFKRLYGKDNAHRKRNIALTAAGATALGAGAGYGIYRAVKAKKAKNAEKNSQEESKKK